MTNARWDDEREFAADEPVYVISIAARIVGMHAQTLRQYERLGLVEPKRTGGNIRMYSQADIARMRQIQRLVNDLGVNLAGVEVILRMSERLQALEGELQRLRAELTAQARKGSAGQGGEAWR